MRKILTATLACLTVAACQAPRPAWEYMAVPFPKGFNSGSIEAEARFALSDPSLVAGLTEAPDPESASQAIQDMYKKVADVGQEIYETKCAEITASASELGAAGWELFSIHDYVFYYRRQL